MIFKLSIFVEDAGIDLENGFLDPLMNLIFAKGDDMACCGKRNIQQPVGPIKTEPKAMIQPAKEITQPKPLPPFVPKVQIKREISQLVEPPKKPTPEEEKVKQLLYKQSAARIEQQKGRTCPKCSSRLGPRVKFNNVEKVYHNVLWCSTCKLEYTT